MGAAFEAERDAMIERQLRARGLVDPRLLAAFRRVPRHRFVPPEHAAEAYSDHPIPIGAGQTISQPYIVGLMVGALRLVGHERVLEIGTGSGFQTAILAELALDVYSVERVPELRREATRRMADLGYQNVQLTDGNGSLGWPAHAPYDAIIVSAAAPSVPPPLLAQLGADGRLVIPIGPAEGQTLVLLERHQGTVNRTDLAGCLFVPLIGDYGWSA